MKVIVLTLLTFYSYQNMWHPHEKEMIALMWKAEHSPEKVLAKKNTKVEQMDYERSAGDEKEGVQFRGITKYISRSLSNF